MRPRLELSPLDLLAAAARSAAVCVAAFPALVATSARWDGAAWLGEPGPTRAALGLAGAAFVALALALALCDAVRRPAPRDALGPFERGLVLAVAGWGVLGPLTWTASRLALDLGFTSSGGGWLAGAPVWAMMTSAAAGVALRRGDDPPAEAALWGAFALVTGLCGGVAGLVLGATVLLPLLMLTGESGLLAAGLAGGLLATALTAASGYEADVRPAPGATG